jgi:hypothetical protein
LPPSRKTCFQRLKRASIPTKTKKNKSTHSQLDPTTRLTMQILLFRVAVAATPPEEKI